MKHKHADNMAAYAADAQTTDKPWELWQFRYDSQCWHAWVWRALTEHPTWHVDYEFRRKPQEHTIVLNTEQLKEILMACDYPDWQNENFKTGVQTLEAALGIQPKTNAQIACDMLGQAHDALEAHSAEICEPNVDHIQKLVWDAMKLLEGTK